MRKINKTKMLEEKRCLKCCELNCQKLISKTMIEKSCTFMFRMIETVGVGQLHVHTTNRTRGIARCLQSKREHTQKKTPEKKKINKLKINAAWHKMKSIQI